MARPSPGRSSPPRLHPELRPPSPAGRGGNRDPDAGAACGTRLRNIDRIADAPLPGGYGEPTTIMPRLGQRSFRIAVLDTYARRCAITNERTLPALEAAHIRDFSDVPRQEITNGILFRADILQRAVEFSGVVGW